MPENHHMGHRQRMLDKFRRFGLEIFSDHEVLEMLLYFAVRQGDTNPTAHRLMQRFGSLHAVLEATEDELQTVVDKVDLESFLEKLGHGLLDELVGDGLLGLILIGGLG